MPALKQDQNFTCLGKILSVFGVAGAVKIKSFTENPLDIANYGPLQDRHGHIFTISGLNLLKDDMIRLSFDQIHNRTQAEALKGTSLYVERDRLPSLEEEEAFYHADLIGLHAYDLQHNFYGKMIAVHNFGSSDILEIMPQKGNSSILIPFTLHHVPDINIEEGHLTLQAIPEPQEKKK